MGAIFLAMFLSTITTGATTELERSSTERIIGIRALQNLLNVFLETAESRKFREYIRKCIRSYALVQVDGREWKRDPIEVDDDGNITGILLFNHQLTNSAIGDLSKLPSTLRVLYLVGNNFTTLNVAALPRGLRILYLVRNQLSDLSLTKLPPSLTGLFLNQNKLSSVHLAELPQTLVDLWLSHNSLSAVDLSALPPNLKYISLEFCDLTEVDLSKLPPGIQNIRLGMNYLDKASFSTFPNDGRQTEVQGEGLQRGKMFYDPTR